MCLSSAVCLFFVFFVKKSSRILREEDHADFQLSGALYFFSIEALRMFFIHTAARTASIGVTIYIIGVVMVTLRAVNLKTHRAMITVIDRDVSMERKKLCVLTDDIAFPGTGDTTSPLYFRS